VLLAGNVMEPVDGDAGKTRLTLITHLNPGGIVDNAIGAAIVNKVRIKLLFAQLINAFKMI